MTIEKGQRLPNATLMQRQEDQSIQKVDIADLAKGRKIALIGMPGAFTGTCSGDHMPSLIARAPEIRAQTDRRSPEYAPGASPTLQYTG